MSIQAYLFFPGSAKTAMEFYQNVFGGELTITLRGDVDPTATEEDKTQVINALLASEEMTLRASDRGDTDESRQNRIELTINGNDDLRQRRIYDALTVNGSIDSPLEKHFWGDTWGKVTDQFGITWQVNIEVDK